MDEEGYAIISIGLLIAITVALGAGASVVVQQSNLISSANRAHLEMTKRAHESLVLMEVEGNSENTEIALLNDGSTPSVVENVLIERENGSFEAEPIKDSYAIVDILDSENITLSISVEDTSTVGVLTRLGNVFWEPEEG